MSFPNTPASLHHSRPKASVCLDIGNRQRCRRHRCECIHPISSIFVGFHLIHLVGTSLGVIVPGLTVHGNIFAEVVYTSFLQHTNQRSGIILHYQAAKRFEVVTRQQGSNMLLGSMTTEDIMATRAFVFGMSCTHWAIAAEYQQYINADGPPVDTRVTRGGSGRNTGRGRSPSVRRRHTSQPTTTRISPPWPDQGRPQRRSQPATWAKVPSCPAAIPHNKQPCLPPPRAGSPTSRMIQQACCGGGNIEIKPMPESTTTCHLTTSSSRRQ